VRGSKVGRGRARERGGVEKRVVFVKYDSMTMPSTCPANIHTQTASIMYAPTQTAFIYTYIDFTRRAHIFGIHTCINRCKLTRMHRCMHSDARFFFGAKIEGQK